MTIWKVFIFVVIPILFVFMVHELIYLRKKPQSPLKRLKYSLDEHMLVMQRLYQDERLDSAFRTAGMPAALTAWQYRFFRDGLFIVWVIYLHAVVLVHTHTYPIKGMILLAVCYVLSWSGHRYFPVRLLLDAFQKDRQAKKNDEVFDLYLLLSNDYHAESAVHYQSVYRKLSEYSRYMKALRKDLDQLLFEYPIDSGRAFKQFGERVGTKESRSLASLLERIDHANPEVAVDLLDENYESFLDFRRQRRKRKLKLNGYFGFMVVFVSVLTLVYFMNVSTNVYKSMLLEVLNQ
ncbi:hypothetical protein HUB94_20285 (plasmid) [Paenibacillus cellulosilyticus]|uniref:hypothetical protein n=1 Tax=Paenibacillus cellulosilyticus TaxID=375489 RepID=UPI0011B3C9F7|nr:hypothetical protein [Paenibacillus cellulosilyticus]QKS46824.1 hypothetical protein HUB94_20285 [Paenibacillus cellulosilyticus]